MCWATFWPDFFSQTHLVTLLPGPMLLWLFKYFRRKILTFFAQATASFGKKYDHNIKLLRKTPFFWQKSQKIVIITSTPCSPQSPRKFNKCYFFSAVKIFFQQPCLNEVQNSSDAINLTQHVQQDENHRWNSRLHCFKMPMYNIY
jgi:hypothetical protein